MRRMGFCILIGFLLAVSLFPGNHAARAQVRERYFPETGHKVTGEFLDFYESVPYPELLYGYPITDSFQDEGIRRIVQYFQKARFELHPEEPESLRVQLTPLGKFIYQPGPPLPVPQNFPACRVFTETGYKVCYAFLDFFEAQGGAAQFGYPISNFELHDHRIVQYFQNARFEWRPEMPPGQRVSLTDLGTQYFYLLGEYPIRLGTDDILQVIVSLQAKAYPQDAVVPLSGEQVIYVVVQDQNHQPIAGAEVAFTVRLPSGEQQRLQAEVATDKDGVAKIAFSYESDVPGLAIVWVDVQHKQWRAHTRTSFRLW